MTSQNIIQLVCDPHTVDRMATPSRGTGDKSDRAPHPASGHNSQMTPRSKNTISSACGQYSLANFQSFFTDSIPVSVRR